MCCIDALQRLARRERTRDEANGGDRLPRSALVGGSRCCNAINSACKNSARTINGADLDVIVVDVKFVANAVPGRDVNRGITRNETYERLRAISAAGCTADIGTFATSSTGT